MCKSSCKVALVQNCACAKLHVCAELHVLVQGASCACFCNAARKHLRAHLHARTAVHALARGGARGEGAP